MIISHRHKFVFVKTRKTGGTSTEIALSEHCGPSDVITRIDADDEAERQRLGYRGPQNENIPIRGYTARNVAGALRHRKLRRFVHHTPASTAAKVLGPERWAAYFTFTIERNPFDRAISFYWWDTRELCDRPGIDQWVQAASEETLSNWGTYASESAPIVDRVIRYDDLAEELRSIGERLGLAWELPSRRSKSVSRSDRRHYSEVLSAGSRARIERVCRREIEEFGMAFA